MEDYIQRINSDPEFRDDIRELKERSRWSDESEKSFGLLTIFQFFKIRKNTKELENVGKRIATNARLKYHLSNEELKALFKDLYQY